MDILPPEPQLGESPMTRCILWQPDKGIEVQVEFWDTRFDPSSDELVAPMVRIREILAEGVAVERVLETTQDFMTQVLVARLKDNQSGGSEEFRKLIATLPI